MQHKCNKSKCESSFCPKFTPALFSGSHSRSTHFPCRIWQPPLTTTFPLPMSSQSPGSTDCLLNSSHPQHSAIMQAFITSHLDYHHRLLNDIQDGPLATLKSSQLPAFSPSNGKLCLKPSRGSLLPPYHSGQSPSFSSRAISMSCLHAPLPAFFLTLMSATPSHLLCLEGPSLQLLVNSEQVSPPSGNSPLQCTAVLSTCYTYLFMPLFPLTV